LIPNADSSGAPTFSAPTAHTDNATVLHIHNLHLIRLKSKKFATGLLTAK
jgi:hypothetical protein